MDALELPLPANVVVSKLLATDGFGRVGEPENRGSDGAGAPVFGSHKLSGCSPYRSEKYRMVKQKRGQDGRKMDKKNFRGCLKSKYDCFTAKAGLTNCDSASGGNNILGIYGLKSDLHDVTKYMDDLSLNELLDSSYKYPSLCPAKGMRAPSVNENILSSVRKACSILPLRGAVDNNVDGKAVINLLKPNCSSLNLSECDNKDKSIDESVPCSKPKDILKRLTLPPAQELDALLLSTMHMTTFRHASLPPFPWSFCHGVACKPSVDVGKLASTKSTSQGKWVRIGSNSTSFGDDQSCFSEMELKSFNHNEGPLIQQKIDDLLQDVNTLTASVEPPYEGPSSTLCTTSISPEAHSASNVDLKKEPGVSGSFISKRCNLMEEHVESSDSHLEFDYKDSVFLKTSESEVRLRFKGLEPNLVDPSQSTLQFEDNEVTQKAQDTVGRHGCSEKCSCYSCKSTSGGCDQSSRYFLTPKISKPGNMLKFNMRYWRHSILAYIMLSSQVIGSLFSKKS
ncbi:hypothetical protein COCNU_02G003530 [Cocos nucifera]|uniref:Uncharacterized protein n=1 Tax=Cocos nucifera TaxID=13894 RepID=A0A8K0HYA2_COCNU|nr:hypothetical protein COCNU_02G003530 [Cocos nucifera]